MNELGKRIENLRKNIGLTQRQMAHTVGCSQSAIQMIEDGTTKNSKHIPAIAKALGVEMPFLMFGMGSKIPVTISDKVGSDDHLHPSQADPSPIPIISLRQAATWPDMSDEDISNPLKFGERMTTRKPHSSRAFCVSMEDHSMTTDDERSIPVGAEVIADPKISPRSGSLVVAITDGMTKAAVIEYLEANGKKFLKSRNKDFPPMYEPSGLIIIGVITEWHKNFSI